MTQRPRLQPSCETTPEAYRLAADCYHQLGQHRKAIKYHQAIVANWPDYDYPKNGLFYLIGGKYCGAYVVWHTLHYYGLGKPIDIIVKEMQIERNNSNSIYEIVQELKTDGVSAHAVKFHLDKISTIDRPFIQYIAPIKGKQLGHFLLCIPTGSGEAVILDGAEEPKIFELAFFEDHNYQETGWDGTGILIDDERVRIRISEEKTSGLLHGGLLLVLAQVAEKHPENS